MSQTESLMGNGVIYQEGGQSGVNIKYQLQVDTSDRTGMSEWQGYVRFADGKTLPGGVKPTNKTSFLLILTDNDSRVGRVKVDQTIGQVGDFMTYSVSGSGIPESH